jgi:hypothetical protein
VEQFVLPFAATVSKYTIYQVVAAVGAGDIGIYNTAGVRLLNSGVGFSTNVGTQLTVPIYPSGAISPGPVTLQAGVYFLARTASVTTAQWSFIPVQNATFFNANGTRIGLAANAASGGVLPGTLGAITADVNATAPTLVYFER